MASSEFRLEPIGLVRSTLASVADAPRQGDEGAPSAWIEVDDRVAKGLAGISPGDELIVLTWLHHADRKVLEVHPRGNPKAKLSGVFATRSPHRPNPIGLHAVRVLAMDGNRLHVGPLEAIDGTPVIDIKPVLGPPDQRG